jgi:hypothetical protein
VRYKTLKEIIAIADELNPNAYSNNIKAQWVNEVETAIQTEVFVIAPVDVVSFLPYEDNEDKELSLDETWDKIYLTYLQAMIDFSNKEYAAFNNDIALYNSYVDTYAKWYVRHHGEGEALISGMYLSAYGIAVKYGFSGSEEEWIASLKGEKGDTGHGLEIKKYVETYEDLPSRGSSGDIYQVSEEGLLYLWDGKWVFLGSYKGEKGVGIETIMFWETTEFTRIGILLTDGTSTMFYIPNGKNGDKGDKGDTGAKGNDGKDGYTPVRGTDYWTDADKAEIKSYVDEAILGGSW